MYRSFYGFRVKPFQLKPDPNFFFGSKGHKRAMAYLEYGLSQGEGFIVITGEVGAGKTTWYAIFSVNWSLRKSLPLKSSIPIWTQTTH